MSMTKTRILTALTSLVIRATIGSLSKMGVVARTYPSFLLLAAGLLAFPGADSATAGIEQPGFTATTIATGVDRPTAMAIAPDGRIFVAAQQGIIRIVPNGGGLLPTPFLDIRNNVDSSGERGILGIALDPDFQNNNWVYVYYTSKTPTIHNRVSRFTANGNVVQASSETVLLDIETLSSATNHNGGAIHFGPSGNLLIAVGDNNDGANAQSLSNLKGKILRIRKDGSIPPENPFYNITSGNNRSILVLGLRNPFSFAIQRDVGRLYINDVGQNTWEEINEGITGANYGWPLHEGPDRGDPFYQSPIFIYDHTNGNCAITGAAFYDPITANFPSSYVGDYFFADFCNGWIRGYDITSNSTYLFATGLRFLTDIQVDRNGTLYYLERVGSPGAGRVTKVTYTGG